MTNSTLLVLLANILMAIPAQSDQAVQMPPVQVAQMDACSAFFNWKATQPACDAIKAQAKSGHLVSESEFNNWCGMASKYLKDAEAGAVEYQKLAHKKVQIEECPPESQLTN